MNTKKQKWNGKTRIVLVLITLMAAVLTVCAGDPEDLDADALEEQFRELPMEARQLTGPLFWLHGDENETKQRLEECLESKTV